MPSTIRYTNEEAYTVVIPNGGTYSVGILNNGVVNPPPTNFHWDANGTPIAAEPPVEPIEEPPPPPPEPEISVWEHLLEESMEGTPAVAFSEVPTELEAIWEDDWEQEAPTNEPEIDLDPIWEDDSDLL